MFQIWQSERLFLLVAAVTIWLFAPGTTGALIHVYECN